MARYIDLDKVIEDVKSVSTYYSEGEEVKELCLYELELQPIADVVPRAEIEEWKEIAETYQKMFENSYEAKQEVANLIIQEMQGRLNKLMYLEAPRHIQVECYLKVQIELDEVRKKYIGE